MKKAVFEISEIFVRNKVALLGGDFNFNFSEPQELAASHRLCSYKSRFLAALAILVAYSPVAYAADPTLDAAQHAAIMSKANLPTNVEYGDKDHHDDASTMYFKWTTTQGNTTLTDSTASDQDITYYINNSRPTASDRIYLNQNDNASDIEENFIGKSNTYNGGAIENSSTNGFDITGDFIGNYAAYSGGAIYNVNTSDDYGLPAKINNIKGDFVRNHSNVGGAINNTGAIINNIIGDFIGNYAVGSGGAIYNYTHYGTATIGSITGDFIGNYASSSYASGGAIYNYGTIGNITGDFIGNYASSSSYSPVYGGAINNSGTIGETDTSGKVIGGISGSFINNYAKTESTTYLALGGAVWTNKDLNFIANDKQIEFSGNYTEDPTQGKVQNAIWVDTPTPVTITLKAQNDGSITLNDQIDGGTVSGTTIDRTKQYTLALTGDDTGKIILNNDIKNANITLDTTNIYLSKENVFDQSNSLTLNSGTMFLNNNAIGTMQIPTLNLNGNTNISVDADLANNSMDRITANTYNITPNSTLNVNNIILLSDATADKTTILFADKELAQNVTYTGVNPVAYSPIYKYNVNYSTNPDDNLGYFTFVRGGASSNTSDNYNPAVLAPSVATQAGAYTTQLQTFNYAFQHSENFMNIPYLERIALKNTNKYALSPTGDATDVGTFSPLLTKEVSEGFWVKPYASFENVPLKNGPKVNNINYGTLIGHDSALTPIKHGWDRVLTTYIGYNGSSQRFSGVDSYQNGGILGLTTTLYKNNFFNATTISVGASAGNNSGMYGSENFALLLAGIANKTGYNIEFIQGKLILQPSMLISYTFVNTFDYNNAAGLKIESDPLNAIQLAPGIKLIGNTKSGWQPYLGVSMVWNLLDKSKVTADDVRLPEMSIKPYVQYGIGIQKRWADTYTAYAQAMIHNGGRNGISLSGGFRWAVGKK